jgi:hypothetical protein
MMVKSHSFTSISAFALIAALVGTFAVSSAGAATLPIASSGYGVWADLTVLGGVTATIGPAAEVSGIAPPAYNLSSGIVDLDASVDLKTGGLVPVTLGTLAATGVLTSTASSPFPPTPTSTATSTVDRLSLDLKTAGLVPLTILDVSATTITSTSSASALVSPNTATGSSSIEDLTISGLAVGTPITLTGTVDPTPNDVILNLAGLTITLNQQILSGNGFDGKAIVTDAIAINFSSVPLGTGVLNGQIVIANSVASVPEAATWLDMLAGFGAAGLLMLRRAKSKTAATT